MNEFIAKFGDQITGILSGFDRLVLRGTLRAIVYAKGMGDYLGHNGVLLKDFARHVQEVSARVKQASLATAKELRRTVMYLASSAVDKEKTARALAAEQKITEGLVCVLTCVEPCQSFEVYRNAEEKKLELETRLRKCLFLYHYSIHPVFGFMHARIQTWFPFSIQICLNGREWLARQMDAEGLHYLRQDNCFPWIEDWARAQELMNAQLRVKWPKWLDAIAQQLDPLHGEIFQRFRVAYYWSTHQSEWASDIAFREAATLRRLHPLLIQHALTTMGSPEVLRFLGRRTRLDGQVPRSFHGEVTTDVREREEGVASSTRTPRMEDRRMRIVMNCNEAEPFVSVLYDGEPLPAEVANHVDGCPNCHARLRSYCEMGAELRLMASKAPHPTPPFALPDKHRPPYRPTRLAFLRAWGACAQIRLGAAGGRYCGDVCQYRDFARAERSPASLVPVWRE